MIYDLEIKKSRTNHWFDVHNHKAATTTKDTAPYLHMLRGFNQNSIYFRNPKVDQFKCELQNPFHQLFVPGGPLPKGFLHANRFYLLEPLSACVYVIKFSIIRPSIKGNYKKMMDFEVPMNKLPYEQFFKCPASYKLGSAPLYPPHRCEIPGWHPEDWKPAPVETIPPTSIPGTSSAPIDHDEDGDGSEGGEGSSTLATHSSSSWLVPLLITVALFLVAVAAGAAGWFAFLKYRNSNKKKQKATKSAKWSQQHSSANGSSTFATSINRPSSVDSTSGKRTH